VKKEYKISDNYAEGFIDYLDKSLITEGFAKNTKTLKSAEGGIRAGIGPNGDIGLNKIYQIKSNPELGLRILSQKDYGYNKDPKNWAWINAFVVPWKEVEKLEENSETDIKGENILDNEMYMVTSLRDFNQYKTYEELKNEILDKLDKKTNKKQGKGLENLFGGLIILSFLFSINSITGASIGLGTKPSGIMGIILFLIGIIGIILFNRK
jgi:hypothetical protein